MSDSSPLHVLLAEDDVTQCVFVSKLLRDAGYVVDIVHDGKKALDELSSGRYQILLTDWEMPLLDGLTLCCRARELSLPGYLYIFMLTVHTTTQRVVAGLDAGADDYIRKPLDPSELLARLRAGCRVLKLEQSLRQSIARIHLLSITDGLLGVFNRRYFNEKLPAEVRRANRYQRRLSLVIADLDHFKQVNDRYGHPIGDEVLKRFAQLAQSQLRLCSDWIARIGGEEFVIVLPEADLAGASNTAEKLRRACSAQPFVTTSAKISITASFGVAELPSEDGKSPETQAQDIIRRADTALYQSKTAGRNRITRADLLPG